MTDLDETQRTVVRQHDAFNQGDTDAAAAFFAEHTRNHGRPVGREMVRAVLKDIQATFPDVQLRILQCVVEGEWVTVRCTFSGTHQGMGRLPVNGGLLVGVQPTGRFFEVQHIHRYCWSTRILTILFPSDWPRYSIRGRVAPLKLGFRVVRDCSFPLRVVRQQYLHMYQIQNGQIVEHFANRDDIGMMQQLGLLPSAPPTAAR